MKAAIELPSQYGLPGGRSQHDREMELIQRVCRGENDAFQELVRPHERAIYLAAMGVLDNSADAEEVAQEAVIKAYNALGQFRFEAKFST